MEQPRLVTLGQATPAIEGAWVAPSATLIGAVTLGPEASVWYATVLRADHDRITIGSRTNVQDGCVMHADPGLPVTVGTGVGAMVLNGAHIGAGSLVAAGSVVLEGTRIPPGSLVAGLPAKVRRPLTAEEREGLRGNAADYVELVARHREATG
jgi:carbonic anhydrase/acetyltransferase-like protein (isoleucine patch superfamily)